MDIQDAFNRLIYYSSDYNILVCKEHQYAIQKSDFRTHLTTLYSTELSSPIRNQIVQFGLNQCSGEPIDPIGPISPIPFLKIKDPAFQCLFLIDEQSICGYIRGDIANIKAHLRDKHSWNNPRKRGRYSSIQANILPEYISQIAAQTLYPKGRGIHYFQVNLSLNRPRLASSNRENPSLEDRSGLFELASQTLQIRNQAINQSNSQSIQTSLYENQPNL